MGDVAQPRDEVGRFIARTLKKKDPPIYYQLKEEERARGFVRPYRAIYTHKRCGKDTTIVSVLAENFARFPTLNSYACCTTCNKSLPVKDFVWKGSKEVVGS